MLGVVLLYIRTKPTFNSIKYLIMIHGSLKSFSDTKNKATGIFTA